VFCFVLLFCFVFGLAFFFFLREREASLFVGSDKTKKHTHTHNKHDNNKETHPAVPGLRRDHRHDHLGRVLGREAEALAAEHAVVPRRQGGLAGDEAPASGKRARDGETQGGALAPAAGDGVLFVVFVLGFGLERGKGRERASERSERTSERTSERSERTSERTSERRRRARPARDGLFLVRRCHILLLLLSVVAPRPLVTGDDSPTYPRRGRGLAPARAAHRPRSSLFDEGVVSRLRLSALQGRAPRARTRARALALRQ
jgi:hypothetical protein